jgi:hypothetical protein
MKIVTIYFVLLFYSGVLFNFNSALLALRHSVTATSRAAALRTSPTIANPTLEIFHLVISYRAADHADFSCKTRFTTILQSHPSTFLNN